MKLKDFKKSLKEDIIKLQDEDGLFIQLKAMKEIYKRMTGEDAFKISKDKCSYCGIELNENNCYSYDRDKGICKECRKEMNRKSYRKLLEVVQCLD